MSEMRTVARTLVVGLLLLAPLPAQETAAASPRFLDKDAARKAIQDETVEPYFALLNEMEIEAKTGRPAVGESAKDQREACRRAYGEAALEFTPAEKKALRWLTGLLQKRLKSRYPRFAAVPWSFLKLSSSIEGGLPHTRGGHIVFSPQVLGFLGKFVAGVPEDFALRTAGTLLLHEQMHVYQRAHPKACAELYTSGWGFVRASSVAGCRWLDEYRVVNPDGVRAEWVWPVKEGEKVQWVWPQIVFAEKDGPKRMPADFRMIAVEVSRGGDGAFAVRKGKRGRPVSHPLGSVERYVETFAPTQDLYHPNEIAADLFAGMVVRDILEGERPRQESRGMKALRAWARKHLGPER